MKKYVLHSSDWVQMMSVDDEPVTLYSITTGMDMFKVIEAEDENDPALFAKIDDMTEITTAMGDFVAWEVSELNNDVYRKLYDFIALHDTVDFQFNEGDMETTMQRLRGKILYLFCRRFVHNFGLENYENDYCYVSNDHKKILCKNGKMYPVEALAMPFFGEKIVSVRTKTQDISRLNIATQQATLNCILEEVITMPAILGSYMFKGHEFWPDKPERKVHPMHRPD